MEDITEQLLLVIDTQQSLIRKLTRMVVENKCIDDALRTQVKEESAESERMIRAALEG